MHQAAFRILFITAACAAPAFAAEPDREERAFDVTVDGKPAGSFSVACTAADGKQTVTARASVKVKTLLGSYKYTLDSTEVWEEGKLTALDATTVDDGKKSAVTAAAKKGGLEVTTGGKTRTVSAAAISTTGWFLPDPPAEKKSAAVVVLDAEDGSDTKATVERLADSEWEYDGKKVTVRRFKLTGKDLDAEWWYDTGGKPVRLATTWDGHAVVFALAGGKR